MRTFPLNVAQQNAIEDTHGVVAVIAGPGTGKTHTLTTRIISLVQQRHIPAENILAFTFTIKSAHEIYDRIQQHISDNHTVPTVATIHSFCFRFLTKHLGTPPTVIDRNQQLATLQPLIKQTGLKTKSSPAQALKKILSAKVFPEPLSTLNDQEQQLFINYQQKLAEQGLYDYEDLITETNRLFVQNVPTSKEYRDRYQFIHVDEFQDLNQPQQTLVVHMTQTHQNLFLIGDPNQSIYSFRGAYPNGFEQIKLRFPDARTYTLGDNYRSGQTILNVAHSLIVNNLDSVSIRPLSSQTSTPGSITLMYGHNRFHEARYIVEKIQQLLGGITRQNFDTKLTESHGVARYNFGNIAILLRNKRQEHFLRRYLLQSGIPFELFSEQSLFTYPHLDELITALQVKSDNKLETPASLSQYIAETIDDLNLDSAHETLQYLITEATIIETGNPTKDIPFFLQYLKILQYDHQASLPPDKVVIMTIHASKGLEFPVVFVPGLDENILPSRINHADDDKIAEERRLLYVAITRAKQELYLSSGNTTNPSRFLAEIDKSLVTEVRLVPKKRKPRQLTLF